MEIIAKKYPRLRAFIVVLVASVMLILIGVALIIAGSNVVNFPDVFDYIALALLIIGAACTGMMVFSIVRYCRLPENLITYENGILTFPKGFQCRAEEVEVEKYYEAKPYYKNISYDFGFGLIKVNVKGKTIKVYYVAGVVNATERLRTIIHEAKLMR